MKLSLKALSHRSNENLTFTRIAEIATEIEDAGESAKAQLSNDKEFMNKVVIPRLHAIRKLKKSVDKFINSSKNQNIHSISNDSLKLKSEQICKRYPDMWKEELGCIKDIELSIKFKPEFS
ncbi:hypothetical protein RF11_05623 [Thelohanellus kitauei]|uniref:Uncharacterized protein n=1 Tax=Thelohanellus kitauei TaxID=669202 RepID=A0A0C2IW19_THEKT|nr:hypothetical protein RF11_05623 [Thelohanellus kitauei]